MEADAVQNQRVIQVTRSWAERSLSEVLRSVLRMLLLHSKRRRRRRRTTIGIGHWQPCDVAPLTSSSSSIGGAGAKMEPAAVVERRSRCQQVGEHTSS